MPDPADHLSPMPSPTILVVDDEPAMLALCAAVLQQAGFTVLQADGSPDALKICTNHEGPVDLLLTDVVLPPPGFQLASSTNQFPHVHGHELARRAALIRPGLRVALMAGKPDQEPAGHGIKCGTIPLIEKPFVNADFISFVRDVLAAPAPALNPSGNGESTHDVDWFD